MNTTVTSKTTTRRFAITPKWAAVLSLIALVIMLGAAFYVSAPQRAAAAMADHSYVSAGLARPAHDNPPTVGDSSYDLAERARFERQRGLWAIAAPAGPLGCLAMPSAETIARCSGVK